MKTLFNGAPLSLAFSAALVLISLSSARAVDGTWKSTAVSGGVWSSSTNWTGDPNPVPGGVGSTVLLTRNAGSMSVTIDGAVASRTVGTLNFAGNSYWTINGSGGGTLTFDNSGTNAVINIANDTISGNSNALNTSVILNSSLIINGDSPTRGFATGASGVISGTGSITKNGPGSLSFYFNNPNTFTGGFTLNGGTVAPGNNSGFGTGTLTLNSGTVSNAGGGRSIANALVLGGDVNLAAGFGTITYSGTTSLTGSRVLTVDTVATLGGVISGVGSISKSGVGSLTLSQANTYTGTTTISGGLLQLSNAQALQNSALDTTNSIVGTSTAGLKTIPTTLQLGGLIGNKDLASLFTTTAGGYTAVTALTLNPGTGVTNSYSGVIANGAAGMTLTKTGAGTQILSGANSYTGATTVSLGTLLINNAYSVAGGGISVASLASVGGNATINRNITVADGGTLIAGDGNLASTLTVAANVTLANNSKIHLVLGAAGTHSTLARSSGTWAFDGDQSFTLNPGAASGTYLGIITGLIGSEAGLASIATWSISNPGYAGSEFTYDSGNNWVNLNVVPEPSTAILMGLGLGLTLFGFRARVRRS